MSAHTNALGKLLPKAIKEKRRCKRGNSFGESHVNDVSARPRVRTFFSRRPDTTESDSTVESASYFPAGAVDTETIAENAVPYNAYEESDPDLPQSRPATISNQPSEISYLTTFSSVVLAAHDSVAPTFDNRPLAQSSTWTHLSSEKVYTTQDTKPTLESNSLLSKRSASSNRLRDVFRSKRGTSGTGKSSLQSQESVAEKNKLVSTCSEHSGPILSQVEETLAKATPTTQALARLTRHQVDNRRPHSPPSGKQLLIVNTPPTPTETRHSQPAPIERLDGSHKSAVKTHGRIRTVSGSGSVLQSSKLSNIISIPLTPTLENAPASPGNTAANFLSSMLSAVQNTATSLGNTITNTNIKPASEKSKQAAQKEAVFEQSKVGEEIETSQDAATEGLMDASKEPAVKTLGMGDLSLSHLGIVDAGGNMATPSTARVFDANVLRARSDSAPVETGQATSEALPEDSQKPRSLLEGASRGDLTPPMASVYEDKSGVQRSSSIRSVIAKKRHRGNSANTTGSTGGVIGAAIAAANSSLARPAHGSTPKLTGFAVATRKRNKDFHSQFKTVPDDDYLIEEYSCALQREILLHGRLYVSESHLCFSSNILGWVTTVVMSFDEIVSVEKRSTAIVFKNGLEISTLHQKHIFASFTSRDTTYDLIVKIWKLGHPGLKSSLNGVRLEGTGGDRTEKEDIEAPSVVDSQSLSGTDVESGDEDEDVYDEDEDNDDKVDVTQATELTALDSPNEKMISRKASCAMVANNPSEKADVAAGPGVGADFPGPATHAPTDCGDAASHFDRIIGDDVIAAPLGKVYNLVFGPQSATWMAKWLTVNQKCLEFQMEDKRGLTEEIRTRNYSYIKPLSGSIGPRQTKCITTEQLEHMDLKKSINVLCSTQNPDVPSGNVFSVKTKYCLSWADNNSTRFQASCTIEWTGKSWWKGPIEKGANEGQMQYCKELFASLKAAVSRQKAAAGFVGAAVMGKKRGRKNKLTRTSKPTSDIEDTVAPQAKNDWGLFEPAHPFLGPVVDTVRPLLTGNVVYGLLVGLLVASWFGFGSRQPTRGCGNDLAFRHIDYPQRIAAYEEMWRREESELWDWIEERVGLARLNGESSRPLPPRKKVTEPRTVLEKLRQEKMVEKELKEAIRVTEEKLRVLKSAVEKGNSANTDEDDTPKETWN